MSETTTPPLEPASFNTVFNSILTASDLTTLQATYLPMVQRRYCPSVTWTADYLTAKLTAAEAELSRDLRVFFQPTMVVPQVASQEEIQGYWTAGTPVYVDPGEDYDNESFTGDKWFMTQLRHTPIISVTSVLFVFPNESTVLEAVPPSWIRFAAKDGTLQLVPDQNIAQFAFNGFLLSALSGGRSIPFAALVRYMAGLTNVRSNWPDIITLIYRRAILEILQDLMLPGSASVSGDGLSQSISVDIAKLRGEIDEKVKKLRRSILGVRMSVL